MLCISFSFSIFFRLSCGRVKMLCDWSVSEKGHFLSWVLTSLLGAPGSCGSQRLGSLWSVCLGPCGLTPHGFARADAHLMVREPFSGRPTRSIGLLWTSPCTTSVQPAENFFDAVHRSRYGGNASWSIGSGQGTKFFATCARECVVRVSAQKSHGTDDLKERVARRMGRKLHEMS
jgi:hypothetical protein